VRVGYGADDFLQNEEDAGGQLRCVLSHPFARKKANGWGTGHLCLGKTRSRSFDSPSLHSGSLRITSKKLGGGGAIIPRSENPDPSSIFTDGVECGVDQEVHATAGQEASATDAQPMN
jgi:hypothetical protein